MFQGALPSRFLHVLWLSHRTSSSKFLQHPSKILPSRHYLKFSSLSMGNSKAFVFLQDGTIYYSQLHSRTKSRSSCIPMTYTGIPGFVIKFNGRSGITFRLLRSCCNSLSFSRGVTWPGISVSVDSCPFMSRILIICDKNRHTYRLLLEAAAILCRSRR